MGLGSPYELDNEIDKNHGVVLEPRGPDAYIVRRCLVGSEYLDGFGGVRVS